MSDLARVSTEGETPVNPYSLLEAVNRSSDTAHTAWLIFMAIMTYLMIAVAGVTHTNLLLETPVSLPILNVDIPLTQFFQFAPIVLMLFHFGVVSQLVLLARKALEFDHAIRLLEPTDRRSHPLRLELHNLFFVQAIAGPHRSRVMGAFLHAMSWLTLVILPVVLLLYMQIVFLPYHDAFITWTQRLALVFDIVILVLIGVFLMRAETSFFKAFYRSTRANPVSFVVTTVVLFTVTVFSFFVATIPGERLDQFSQYLVWRMDKSDETEAGPKYYSGYVIPLVPVNAEGALFGYFRRNLVVTDADLVSDRDVTEGEPTLKLRGRDLRFAKLDRSDMHQADLTGADLSEASLVGTDLRNANLQCAELDTLRLKSDRELARCVRAVATDFSKAELSGAVMSGIDARGAKFAEAVIEDADLVEAILSGADFSGARLDKANLTGGVVAFGTNFAIASLQGANLTGARLLAADFRASSLQAAIFDFARLEGAMLDGSDAEAASFRKARLEGANLSGARMTAADLRGAHIWMTTPPDLGKSELADTEDVAIEPIAASDRNRIQSFVSSITSESLQDRVNEAVAKLLDGPTMEGWSGTPDQRTWQTLKSNAVATTAYRAPAPQPVADTGSQPDPGLGGVVEPVGEAPALAAPPRRIGRSFYGQQLTEHLETMICRVRWINGAVATGIAIRALSPAFKGDMTVIDERISDEECLAAQGVPARVVRELQSLADSARDAR